MGTTISISQGYAYYNSTLNTTDWEILLRGFACAAYATLDMHNATYWESHGSLSTTNSHYVDMQFLERFEGRGYGSGVGLEFDPFKERWDSYASDCRAAYSCVESVIKKETDRDLIQYIYYYLSGLQSCENCTLYGDPSIITFTNGTSNSEMRVQLRSRGLLTMKNSEYILNGWAYQGIFELYGVFDGYGATIDCSNYTQCNVYCDGSHSCYGLSLLCDDTSDCTVEYCDNDHIWCPLGNYKIQDTNGWFL